MKKWLKNYFLWYLFMKKQLALFFHKNYYLFSFLFVKNKWKTKIKLILSFLHNSFYIKLNFYIKTLNNLQNLNKEIKNYLIYKITIVRNMFLYKNIFLTKNLKKINFNNFSQHSFKIIKKKLNSIKFLYFFKILEKKNQVLKIITIKNYLETKKNIYLFQKYQRYQITTLMFWLLILFDKHSIIYYWFFSINWLTTFFLFRIGIYFKIKPAPLYFRIAHEHKQNYYFFHFTNNFISEKLFRIKADINDFLHLLKELSFNFNFNFNINFKTQWFKKLNFYEDKIYQWHLHISEINKFINFKVDKFIYFLMENKKYTNELKKTKIKENIFPLRNQIQKNYIPVKTKSINYTLNYYKNPPNIKDYYFNNNSSHQILTLIATPSKTLKLKTFYNQPTDFLSYLGLDEEEDTPEEISEHVIEKTPSQIFFDPWDPNHFLYPDYIAKKKHFLFSKTDDLNDDRRRSTLYPYILESVNENEKIKPLSVFYQIKTHLRMFYNSTKEINETFLNKINSNNFNKKLLKTSIKNQLNSFHIFAKKIWRRSLKKNKVPLTSYNYAIEKKLIKKNIKNLIHFVIKNPKQKRKIFSRIDNLNLLKKLNYVFFSKNTMTQDIYNIMIDFFFYKKKNHKYIKNFIQIYPTLQQKIQSAFISFFFKLYEKNIFIKAIPFAFFTPKNHNFFKIKTQNHFWFVFYLKNKSKIYYSYHFKIKNLLRTSLMCKASSIYPNDLAYPVELGLVSKDYWNRLKIKDFNILGLSAINWLFFTRFLNKNFSLSFWCFIFKMHKTYLKIIQKLPSRSNFCAKYLLYKNYEFLHQCNYKKLQNPFKFSNGFSLFPQQFFKKLKFFKKLSFFFYGKITAASGYLATKNVYAIPKIMRGRWAIDFRRQQHKKFITWGYQRFLELKFKYNTAISNQVGLPSLKFYSRIKNKSRIYKKYKLINASFLKIKQLIFKNKLGYNIVRVRHYFAKAKYSFFKNNQYYSSGVTIPRYFLRRYSSPKNPDISKFSQKPMALDSYFFFKLITIKLKMINHLSKFNWLFFFNASINSVLFKPSFMFLNHLLLSLFPSVNLFLSFSFKNFSFKKLMIMALDYKLQQWSFYNYFLKNSYKKKSSHNNLFKPYSYKHVNRFSFPLLKDSPMVTLKEKIFKMALQPFFFKYIFAIRGLQKYQWSFLSRKKIFMVLNQNLSPLRSLGGLKFFLHQPSYSHLGIYITKLRTRFYVLNHRLFSFSFSISNKWPGFSFKSLMGLYFKRFKRRRHFLRLRECIIDNHLYMTFPFAAMGQQVHSRLFASIPLFIRGTFFFKNFILKSLYTNFYFNWFLFKQKVIFDQMLSHILKFRFFDSVYLPVFVGLLGRGRDFLTSKVGHAFFLHSRKMVSSFFWKFLGFQERKAVRDSFLYKKHYNLFNLNLLLDPGFNLKAYFSLGLFPFIFSIMPKNIHHFLLLFSGFLRQKFKNFFFFSKFFNRNFLLIRRKKKIYIN
jgi:hypothetical protein